MQQQPIYAQPMAGGVPQDGNPVPPVQMQHAPQQMMHQPQMPLHLGQGQPIMSHEVPYQGAPHGHYAAAPTGQSQQPQSTGQQPQPIPPSGVISPPPPPPLEVAIPQVQAVDSQATPLMFPHENGGPDHNSPASRHVSEVESESPSSDIDGLETNDEDDDDDERALKEEIRRLDEDFKKNMLRAQKVFDSRMDNLQRSKEEREAQHLKTLEKHEKERAEFEKRLQQAEKEQNRRIQQLQREWDKKRESLAKHKGAKRKPVIAADVSPSKAEDENLSELAQANAESLGTMTSATSRECLVPPTHKKSLSMNNSESSERSRSSSSASLNGDSGNNSDHGVT